MLPRSSHLSTIRWLLLLLVVSAGASYELVDRSCLHNLADGDVFWHLETGLKILDNRALPHNGIHSQLESAAWIASSWLYDLKLAIGYRMFGLRSIVMVAVLLQVLLAGLVFLLAGGLRGRFWSALLLSLVAQSVLGGLPPLPTFVSALALGIELLVLFEFRRTGKVRLLYVLPVLFLLWANLDSQFVYGLALLVLFGVALAIDRARGLRTEQVSSRVAALLGGSLLASLVTPYGWKPIGQFFDKATSSANEYFPDRLALHFRSPQDYLILLLGMAAFLALGMRRSRDFLQIALLVLCAAAAFHAQGDAWLLVLASVAVLGAHAGTDEEHLRIKPVLVTVLVSMALMVGAVLATTSRDTALQEVGRTYPVKAADYIREQHLPQPLFNPFPWGGFLTWYLPAYPVAIDGRTTLYGEEYNIRYAKVMNAEEHYSAFPPLLHARTILLQKNSLMASALASVPGYRVVYSDELAVVMVREP